MKQEKQQKGSSPDATDVAEKKRKPLRQKGGTYFHQGVIIGCKNVFVTSEYIDLLVNALKMAELKKDIKTLAYVIMPNYFSWMFKLSETQDDPVSIYGDVKRQVAIEIMNSLREECKQEQPYQLVDLFRGNERVSRTSPQRLLWTFQEQAKEFEGNKHFKIWTPKTRLQRLDSPEMITKSLECIKKAPMSERWQMVADAEEYPYLYVSEELADKDGDSVASFVSSIIQPQRAALPA